MRESIETKWAMVTAYPTRADAAEWHVVIYELHDCVIDAAASKR